MALISCPECGRHVSDRAAACPQCGCPVLALGSGSPQVRAPTTSIPNTVEVNEGIDALNQLMVDDDASGLLEQLCSTHFRSWLTSAEQGNPDAQSLVGFSYMAGSGVTTDPAKALEWLRKAVEMGQSIATLFLGIGHLSGDHGLTKDERKGFEFIKTAAEKGVPRAQFMLGGCYEAGNGCSRKVSEAVRWYSNAGEAGFKDAQMRLADLYMKGEVISQDMSKSFYWMHKVAEKGDCWAQIAVGTLFKKGIGVAKDYEAAKKWFDKVYLNFALTDPKARDTAMKESMKVNMLIQGSPEWLVEQLLP